ncbi:transcriptional regulator, TetR family [Kribbella flavida DSM 17836]|uniref:Transcriptional regulator, TetR family n=1 Tax=Kribbella flavida (strain DSM 17836 / JCM 10339 / NBRC 14399) TaxID=479435 RepID=D2PVT2_KRIFD|nr:TetR family transcriptional regulator [Kribbella flavida]ADB29589.1 transcriptional regulator, TetR family [Kribbella flavida DSM 17836]
MRSTEPSRGSAEAASVERIRDAAIVRFGRDGFSAGLRVIAADAGVTAGLVVHHFGSKGGLRQACDEHVLSVIRAEKLKAATTGSAAGMIAQLAEVEQFAPMALYAVRSLQTGGRLATEFVEQMVRDAEQYLAAGVEAGVIKPSRDPAARARYLAYQSLGSLLLWATIRSDALTGDFAAALRELSDEVTPPALELFTQGLFVDRSMLDDYLMYVPDPPVGPAAP